MNESDKPLAAYRQLVERLDAFFSRVSRRHPDMLRCAPGCDECCHRDLSLFPFEAELLMEAVSRLAPPVRKRTLDRAACALQDPQAPCPLLEDARCLVYPARPVICRTHGLPMLIPGEQGISLCPLNFKGVLEFGGECVLDLTPVNQILATVQTLLAGRARARTERVQVSRALVHRFGSGERM